jgi:hypothetical protein
MGTIWKITLVSHYIGRFLTRKKLCIDFDRNGLGYILGDFCTNSSGHPAQKQRGRHVHFRHTGLPDSSLFKIPKRGKIKKVATKLPNCHYVNYQMVINIPYGCRIYQIFSFQGPPKLIQIRIFGLKTYHLATPLARR